MSVLIICVCQNGSYTTGGILWWVMVERCSHPLVIPPLHTLTHTRLWTHTHTRLPQAVDQPHDTNNSNWQTLTNDRDMFQVSCMASDLTALNFKWPLCISAFLLERQHLLSQQLFIYAVLCRPHFIKCCLLCCTLIATNVSMNTGQWKCTLDKCRYKQCEINPLLCTNSK